MVRHGVGVVVAVVALAGCGGGSSDEEQVVDAVKDFKSAAERRDGEKLCREIFHPNTVHVADRMARADAAPGEPRPSCEQRYRTSTTRTETIDGRDPTTDDVTIKGDLGYLPDGDDKRPIARRDGGTWKIDFTADPALHWLTDASFACVRWQDTLQAMPLPPANRRGIIASLRAQAAAMATFRSELHAGAALGQAKPSAADLAAALDRMSAKLDGVAAALRRGRSLDAATQKVAKESGEDLAAIFRAAKAVDVRCGRIPGVARDGAAFRRKADALCQPVVVDLASLPQPGPGPAAATRYLRRISAAERRARRDLASLKPPADLDSVYRDTLSTLGGIGATLSAESAAIARDDAAGVQRAVARIGPLDFRKGVGFNRLGLRTCARL
jgi:hypothetical protein